MQSQLDKWPGWDLKPKTAQLQSSCGLCGMGCPTQRQGNKPLWWLQGITGGLEPLGGYGPGTGL